jgi:hypothetical protein
MNAAEVECVLHSPGAGNLFPAQVLGGESLRAGLITGGSAPMNS